MIKTMLLIIVFAVVCMFLVGCVSSEDKARLIILEEKAEKYEDQAAEIYAKVLDRSLTIGEAEALFENIRSDIKPIADEIKILQTKGYNISEIILAILERLAIVGASWATVRLSRGSIHNRKGEAPA